MSSIPRAPGNNHTRSTMEVTDNHKLLFKFIHSSFFFLLMLFCNNFFPNQNFSFYLLALFFICGFIKSVCVLFFSALIVFPLNIPLARVQVAINSILNQPAAVVGC